MKKKVLGIMLLIAGLCFAAQAADIVRAAVNTNNIESGAAWTGGIAPTSSDVAVWNATYGASVVTNPLGADVSWQGIRAGTLLNRNVIINGTAPTITLGSAGIDMTQSRFNFTINPSVSLGASQTWAVTNTKTLTVNGIVSGAAGNVLTKDDLGTLTLNGANSYSGGTLHNAGTLIVGNNSALGSGGLTMKSGSILQGGSSTSTVTLANNVTLDGNAAFAGANDVRLDGVISGSGSLTKNSSASIVLTLSGNNTYSGGTTNLNGGRISILNVNALGTGAYTVSNAAVTYFNGDLHTGNGGLGITNDIVVLGGTNNFNALHSDTVLSGTISGEGTISGNGFSDGKLTLTGNNTNWSGGISMSGAMLKLGHVNAAGTGGITLKGSDSLLGVSTDLSAGSGVANDVSLTSTTSTTINIDQNLKLSGVISGYGGVNGVIKSGTGSLILSGANTYTGLTTVSAGKLLVNGSLTSDITVQNGGTLGGSGTVQAVTVDAGGILAPGDSPDTMTFEGDVLLSTGSTNIMEITDIAYDILMGAGTNTLTMDGETVFDFSGFSGGVTNGYTLALSSMFVNWGSVVTTGTTYSAVGLGAGQSLDFTGGNLTVIPEPATVGMLGLGALITIMIRRVRRSN